jgi:hypothetical protein
MDSELVRRKKMGGRAGRKKWAKQSDTTALQLHDLKQVKKAIAADRPKSAAPLFKIQIEPDVEAKKKLDKDRFKVQAHVITSKAELKKIKKLEKVAAAQKAESQPVQSKSVPKAIKFDADVEADFDVWEADLKELNIHHDKPQINTKNAVEIPKTLVPYAGQSYNPAYQDQIELMKVIVDKAEPVKPMFKSKSEKAQEKAVQQSLAKRPPQKPRTKKEKEEMEAHEKQRELKRKELESKQIEEYFNEAKNKQRKHGNPYLWQKGNLKREGSEKRKSRRLSRRDTSPLPRE